MSVRARFQAVTCTSSSRALTCRSGELLLDQQKFQESVERFDRSLELDKNR